MGADPRWYPGYLAVDSEEAIENLEKEWCVALRDLDTTPVDIAQMLRDKQIKVAVVLGEDPLGSESFPRTFARACWRPTSWSSATCS